MIWHIQALCIVTLSSITNSSETVWAVGVGGGAVRFMDASRWLALDLVLPG